MANTNVYVALVDGTAQLQNADGAAIGKVELGWQDTATLIVGSGFSDAATIGKVTIFNWSDYGKPNRVAVGAWTSGNQNVGVLNIQPLDATVVMQDNDEGADDKDYGYEVMVTDDGVPYTADPELLAKKKRTSSRAARSDVASTPRAPEPQA